MVPVESYDDARDGAGDGAPDRRDVVLIVEDELLLRWPAAEYLRDAGYRVIEGATVEEAMAVLSGGTRVDIVFSDINLQGELTGHFLSRWVETHYPGVALLMTSGDRDASASIASSTARAFVSKPYVLSEVDKRIRAMLSRK